MQSNLQPEQFLPDTLLKNLYQTGQTAKAALSLAHKNLATEIRKAFFPANIQFEDISPEALTRLQSRFDYLINQDWQDAHDGVYPISLLFEDNLLEFLPSYLKIWLDSPQTWTRMQKQNAQEFPANVNLEKYPQYYRRNFHYQSDGYLSEHSADVYDLQVDILFNGVADAMRRRILKPLKQGLSNNPNLNLSIDEPKILDVACGTGRTLKFIRSTIANASLYGVDLSVAYLRKANQLLTQIPEAIPQLLEGNAENLPYADNYFDAVTNVFLFHELPNAVRQKVIDEFFRVLQPGGVVVIADSIQLSDSADLESMMKNFPLMFHEPFYTDYIKDDS